MSVFRIAGFVCLGLWAVLLIGSLAGWINTRELVGISRNWITLPLLIASFIFFQLGKKRSGGDPS